jgi:outer membrane protein
MRRTKYASISMRISRFALAGFLTLLPVLAAAPAPAYAAEISIAFCDYDRILYSVEEGKDVREALAAEQAKWEKKLTDKQSDLNRRAQDLEKHVKLLSRDAIEREAVEYDRLAADYQAMLVQYRNTIDQKTQDLYAPLRKKLDDLVSAIALRDGYDVILSRRAIAYGRADLDLTDKVIAEYNAAHAGKKKDEPKPKPAASASNKGH